MKNRFSHLWQLLGKTIAEAKVYILGYKEYKAIVYQSGMDAPVLQELENTLGVTVETFYSSPGTYYLEFNKDIFTGPMEQDVSITNSSIPNLVGTVSATPISVWFNVLQIDTTYLDTAGPTITPVDSGLSTDVINVLSIKIYR